MSRKMIPIEVIGLKTELKACLDLLCDLGCVHIDEVSDSPDVLARPLTLDRDQLHEQEEIAYLTSRVEGILDVLHLKSKGAQTAYGERWLAEARQGVDELLPQVQTLTSRRDELQGELATLPLYETTLRKLLPLMPPSAHEAGNVVVGVLVNRAHVAVLDEVARQVLGLTHGRAKVASSDVDESTRAMLIVFPGEFAGAIESLLGQEDISRLRLPAELGGGLPDAVLEMLQHRLGRIPVEIREVDSQLTVLAQAWQQRLFVWRAALLENMQNYGVLSRFGETDMTFVLVGWVPEPDLRRVGDALQKELGEATTLEVRPLSAELKKRAPVALENPQPARPFESLVKMLAVPEYGHIDPTRLMALFMPIFFGMMLGDVGYGVILLVLSLSLSRRYKSGVLHDLTLIIAMGSVYGIIFGFLFGELFGTLGEQLGLHPLWFERGGAEHVTSLLLLTLGVGAVHVTLGLVLGVWEAWVHRSRGHLLERGGMLVGLVGLFLLVSVLTGYLPKGLMTPAVVGIILGIVFLGASLGWLGLLMGPIEYISLVGNVLSYLRIAAIGLASVYLAKVANDMAGLVGNVIVGVILALLIHALNLVLGVFSPTIHSLRLHYVEFFRKFYEGGGRPYEPFRSQKKLVTGGRL